VIIKNGTLNKNKRENSFLLRADETGGLRKCLGYLRKFYVLQLLPMSGKRMQNSAKSPNYFTDLSVPTKEVFQQDPVPVDLESVVPVTISILIFP